ncbi:MAG: hypothetical protein GEV28_15705 [Actinophytocola sp.]|uniref:hypothetical protein n=1 Tax=Actinophytocola sp. TaxID=1872138 RepID=UPI00132853DE|nr:hypothetical protein [Actinophytocola sp.]MPZ81765.1 hypothetical protein [Actinophytocola sp.]
MVGRSWQLMLGAILLGVVVRLCITLTVVVGGVDSRLAQHGYPAGCGTAVGRQAAAARDARR